MKNKKLVWTLFVLVLVLCSQFSFAQRAGGNATGKMGAMGNQMNIGHFYGKIVDNKNKGIAGATVQIIGNKFDTIKKQMKEAILKTVITEANGDFDIEGLMLFGNFKFKATAVGYKPLNKEVSFGVKRPEGAPDATSMQEMMLKTDKDLGNLKMEDDQTALQTVEVTTTAKQQFEMGIDRKIFNVDKNNVSAGQTASELMKSIPSINVDVDGNVSLRGATPTIFVDGRPTTLTLDQIPVDIIDKVEIITNPGAKYDASGGNAGILNIVFKKNKKNGYNGSVRAGIDSRAKINVGTDLSLRQNKLNFTGSINYNQRKSISNNGAFTKFFSISDSSVNSIEDATNEGSFTFLKGGLDFFADNRNTFTFNYNYHNGVFNNDALQTIDSFNAANSYSTAFRKSIMDFNMRNTGSQLSYKHLFTETGHSISADVNYNTARVTRDAVNNSTFKNTTNSINQKTNITGANNFFTAQIDYENQFKENTKFEAGLRSAIRDFKTSSFQYINSNYIESASSNYKFIDAVYAAYTTYSFKTKKTSFQLGLRAESSNYTGTLLTQKNTDSVKFNINYALSLFPSAFITHKLTDKADIQLNYSRRVNRPDFRQLLPNYDFTDPQNPVVGNPNLNPEFTHSFELSYNNAYKKGSNFLVTAYAKYSSNLITSYIYKDENKLVNKLGDSLYYGSYINANNSYSYGLELTNKMTVAKWWDVMMNFNLFYSKLNANIPNQIVANDLTSWFGKLNNTFKWNKGWSLQVNWDFKSRLIIPQSGGRGGMGMGGPGQLTLAQGFILPRLNDVDVAIKKDFTWKNGQSGSINLSWNDIFRARRLTEATSAYFFQSTDKFRDPQIVRLNFTYRFGKVDMSIFKRKNTKSEGGGGMEGM